MSKILSFILSMLCTTVLSFAQKTHENALLYLHTDKTIYTNNEEIWFTGYLVNSGGADVKAHKFMLISLVRRDNNTIAAHQKFVMQDGFGYGNLHLPDTIAPGNYNLIAYTNVLNSRNHPLDIFKQALTIKSVKKESFKANILLADSVTDKAGNYHVYLFAEPDVAGKKFKPEVTFTVGDGRPTAVIQDALGKYEMVVPAKSYSAMKPVLHATVKYSGEFKYLTLKLPAPRPGLNVRFFPEGGNITRKMTSIVGLETKVGEAPASIYGVLLKNNLPVDTIHTDNRGMGSFIMTDDGRSRFTFKELGKNRYDTTYKLPAAIDNKMVLTVAKAVSGDTLKFRISSLASQKVHIIIADQLEEYNAFDHKLIKGTNDFAVDLNNLPVGLAAITILDSLKRPVAERLFFSHYNKRIMAVVKADKDSYAKREKISVTINLTDGASHMPVRGLVSIAAVQGNRLETTKMNDISSYTYLYYVLADSVAGAARLDMNSVTDLEKYMLIKGWRRYTWQDSLARVPEKFKELNFNGKITHFAKELKKPMSLNIVRLSGIDTVTTNDHGYFEIRPEKLYSTFDYKPLFVASARDKADFQISLDDPYDVINKNTVRDLNLSSPAEFVTSTSLWQMPAELNKTRNLKEVVIKGARDNSLFGTEIAPELRTKKSNDCGDWVCFKGILNCTNHPSGKLPVIGQRYQSLSYNPHMPYGVYIGCADEVQKKSESGAIKLDGIYIGKEFYGLTQEDLDVPVPQYVSTLYWNPGLAIDNSGKATFTFFNSDITDKFKIVVQGITDNRGVVSAIQSFDIK